MSEHDPVKLATELSAKLAARSRHVCAFLGAGVSRACGLPDVAMLQERVLRTLQREDTDAFARQLSGRNFEQALSRIRQIGSLLTGDDTPVRRRLNCGSCPSSLAAGIRSAKTVGTSTMATCMSAPSRAA
jgi:hypothetical protein